MSSVPARRRARARAAPAAARSRSSRCGARRRPGDTGGSSPIPYPNRSGASNARRAPATRSASSPPGPATAGPAPEPARVRACPAYAPRRAAPDAGDSWESPTARQPEAGAREQQHDRAAGERGGHLLLLLGLGQPRAEVAVDRRELLGVGGGEELAAGLARDVLQREQVGRHLLGVDGARVR